MDVEDVYGDVPLRFELQSLHRSSAKALAWNKDQREEPDISFQPRYTEDVPSEVGQVQSKRFWSSIRICSCLAIHRCSNVLTCLSRGALLAAPSNDLCDTYTYNIVLSALSMTLQWPWSPRDSRQYRIVGTMGFNFGGVSGCRLSSYSFFVICGFLWELGVPLVSIGQSRLHSRGDARLECNGQQIFDCLAIFDIRS